MPERDYYCEVCRVRLKPWNIKWLELNFRTGRWSDTHGQTPPEESQGWFPVGKDCAKRLLEDAR